MDGIRFVADPRFHLALSGLTIDVQAFYGREGIVAYHSGFGGSC